MDQFYRTQITRNALNDIIQQTNDAIKMKQICRQILPYKCNQQVNGMLFQSLNNAIKQSQQQPDTNRDIAKINNLKLDNRVPFKLKLSKRDPSFFSERKSFDCKSFRKSTAFKSKRDQRTASTNNRNKNPIFSKTFDGGFPEEEFPCKCLDQKRFSRTAEVSSRKKYFELKEQIPAFSIDDDQKRKDLKQKRYLQKIQIEKKDQALIKLSYKKRSMQAEFQAAKSGQKGFSLQKNNKQTNQIVNYEISNGQMLTNRLKKPYRKTIEHIINVEYEDRVKERVLKRKTQRQYQVQKNGKGKGQNSEENDKQRFMVSNRNYNNGGLRQTSLIPYVTITAGVCLSERSIQASISRARPSEQPHQLTRQKFFSTLQNKNFRSFSKQRSLEKGSDLKLMTIDVCDKNRVSKSSLHNETKDSFQRSILWGPKTSREGNRIKLVKQDLLRQLVVQY